MSECGPNCNCEDAQRRRRRLDIEGTITDQLRAAVMDGGLGPSADEMNSAVRTFDSDSEPFTVERGPFKGRIYRRNAAGQMVRQKHLERTARL